MPIKTLSVCLIKNSLIVGGAEKQLVLIANSLVNKGFNVHILYKNSEISIIKKISKRVKLKSYNNSNFRNLTYIYQYVRSNNIEIIHSWDLITSYFSFVVSILTSAKFINGSIRSAPEIISFKRNSVLRKQKGFAIFCNKLNILLISNSKAGFKSYGIQESSKTYVLLNGFELSEIPKRSFTSDNIIRIIMVANMRWKKDFYTLIKAGLKLCQIHDNVLFYLVGDGPDRNKYEELLTNSPFRTRFIFTGHVNNPEEYIAKSHIGLLINDGGGEGISNSIMEYMANKKPVIATNIGGNPELVIENKTGFLINPRDVNGLVDRLNELINQPIKRVEMGEEGYKFIQSNFNIDKMVTSIIGIYNQVKT